MKTLNKTFALWYRQLAARLMARAARLDGATGGWNFSFDARGKAKLTPDSVSLDGWTELPGGGGLCVLDNGVIGVICDLDLPKGD